MWTKIVRTPMNEKDEEEKEEIDKIQLYVVTHASLFNTLCFFSTNPL